MASNKAEKKQSWFDALPIAVQMVFGLGILVAIAAVGFGVFFAVDLLLLDFDPVAKLVSGIANLLKK